MQQHKEARFEAFPVLLSLLLTHSVEDEDELQRSMELEIKKAYVVPH